MKFLELPNILGNKQKSDTFECEQCGVCCYMRVIWYAEDIARLAHAGMLGKVKFQRIEPDANHPKRYQEKKFKKFWNLNQRCSFLNKDGTCGVHEVKPFNCRAYSDVVHNADKSEYFGCQRFKEFMLDRWVEKHRSN